MSIKGHVSIRHTCCAPDWLFWQQVHLAPIVILGISSGVCVEIVEVSSESLWRFKVLNVNVRIWRCLSLKLIMLDRERGKWGKLVEQYEIPYLNIIGMGSVNDRHQTLSQ